MAKAKNDEVLVLPAEEIKKDPIAKLDEAINKSLVKYNVTDKFIADLKASAKDLTIKDQSDKAGYELVHETRMNFVKARTLIKNICEAGRENAVATSRKWIEKQKLLIEQIQADELRLKKMEDEYDAEKERIKFERIEMEKTRLRTRMKELMDMGAVSDGIDVVLDDLSFSVSVIREAEEEEYTNDIVPEYKKIFDVKEKARLEKEADDQKKQKELDDQKADFERKQDLFKKQQEEFENQKKEAKLKIRNYRISQLQAIGMKQHSPTSDFFYGETIVANHVPDTHDDEAWEVILRDATNSVAFAKQQEKEQNERDENERLENARKKAAAELKVKERQAQLSGLALSRSPGNTDWDIFRFIYLVPFENKITSGTIETATDEQWDKVIASFIEWGQSEDKRIEQENRSKILKDEEDRKEQKRLKDLEEAEQASDKDKWVAFISELGNVKIPVMKRNPYKEYVETAEGLIRKIQNIKK